MASARIHEAIALEINKKYGMDNTLLRLGTVAPDSWRNVPKDSGIKDKLLSHFRDFRVKKGQANDYVEFYLKYYLYIDNPFYFGYLIHLISDQYWKTNVDRQYETIVDDKKCFILKNGTIHSGENYFDYYESVKIQKQLSRIYNLSKLPINKEDIKDFNVAIAELNLNGLFGEHGTVNYINENLVYETGDEESILYDNKSILENIRKTVLFVESELERLKKVKNDYDAKIKIAIDIDDTILCTKELEDYYWQIFLKKHPEINPYKNYCWGDPELALFWKEYRNKMAFGKVKDGVSQAFKSLIEKGYEVDLLSARPIDKYSSLKKDLTEYFEKNGIVYNHLHLGFYSKKEYLKEHGYDILIDNDLKYIKEAEDANVIPILYGDSNENYVGYQVNDWSKIPEMVDEIILKKIKSKQL